jgi:peptide/nickel transport system permease protein
MTDIKSAPGEPTAITPESVAAVAPAGSSLSAVAPRVGRRTEALYFAFRNPKVIGGVLVILAFLVLGVVAPLFTDHGPREYVGPPGAAPSGDFWFGTTFFGQDVFIQFANGIRATFLVGVLAALIAAVIGMTIGFVAGYLGGVVDELLMIFTNVILVLPVFVVLIVLTAYIGINSYLSQAVVIGLFAWPWVARAVRAQTFTLRNRDFVDLARLTGRHPIKVIYSEIAPNMLSYLLMTMILLFAGAILFAASLDYLGLGPQGGVSLGLMLQQATAWNALHLGMWWWFIPPGAAITAIVGAAYVTNVGLDEVFNPKLREM